MSSFHTKTAPSKAVAPDERLLRVMASPFLEPDNPYTLLLYQNMQGAEVVQFNGWILREDHFDIAHIHWPEHIFWQNGGFFSIFRTALHFIRNIHLGRKRGMKLVWTVHNLRPHEFGWREALIWPWFFPLFLRHVDGIISLSGVGEDILLGRYPRLRSRPRFVIPHGHYRAVYQNIVSNAEARRNLGIPSTAKVVGFIGAVRPYKNLPELIRCFRALGMPEAALLIAGRPLPDCMKSVIEKLADNDARISCELRFIEDDELQIYFAAADLIVLPFSTILNSGSAMLALSFNRPVLTIAKGALVELARAVGADWMRTYEGPLTSEVLREAIAWAGKEGRAPTAPLDAFDWPALAAQTLRAYRTVLGS